MVEYVEVKTQAQLEKALKRSGVVPVLIGKGSFKISEGNPEISVKGSSSPLVVAWGSSSPLVVAWESSSPRVVARESSSPLVEARGSSSPRVEAWGSSSPHGEVGKYAMLTARRHDQATVNFPGAVILEVPVILTGGDWCDYYGVKVSRGVAILFKAVDDDYSTDRARQAGVFYTPGSKPKAPDWDGGKAECGGGLHFSPHPVLALDSNAEASRFVACPVKVSEIVVHQDAKYPNKVKAPRVCGPVVEVDRFGEPVVLSEGEVAA